MRRLSSGPCNNHALRRRQGNTRIAAIDEIGDDAHRGLSGRGKQFLLMPSLSTHEARALPAVQNASAGMSINVALPLPMV